MGIHDLLLYTPIVKSNKAIKEISSLFHPYTINPPVTIYGGVNGNMYIFPKGQISVVTQGEFESLLTSEYAKYL